MHRRSGSARAGAPGLPGIGGPAGDGSARPVVPRRALLGLAAAALAGCSSSSGSGRPTGTVTTTTSPTLSVAPSTSTPVTLPPSASAAPNWPGLAARLTGRLLRAGDAGYDVYRLAANPRYDAVRPQALARCASAADVAACIGFARDSGVAFTVRSGGHSYGGWSTGEGLVIDLSAMTGGRVDPGTGRLTVAAGTRLVDVYGLAAAAGRGVPAGSCPSVGVAGLTLGGGIGVLARSWGLTCDAITGYQMVDATGAVRQVDPAGEPDLFWAARGGGGGSFGVVTSFTLATRPAPAVTTFYLRWPWSSAAEVVAAWQAWAPVADRRLWSTCKLLTTPSQPRVFVAGTWTGPAAGLSAQLAPLLSAAGAATLADAVGSHTYLQAMLYEAGCTDEATCHLPPVGTLARENEAATSHMPSSLLASAGIRELVSRVEAAAAVPGLTEAGASLDALGGAVADVAPADSAFAHRTSPFSVQYTATWAGARSPTGYDGLVRGIRAAMTPWLGAGAYVNYPDAALPNWQDAYWGGNRTRLEQIKRSVDPDDVFRFAQSVGA